MDSAYYHTDYIRYFDTVFPQYNNMPVAPPGLVYPTTLPGYQAPGQIYSVLSPVKQHEKTKKLPTCARRPRTPSPTLVQPIPTTTQAPAPAPSIIPNRAWLLEALKLLVFTHKGILIGDYPKYDIQKKDITDKFYKRTAELYPSDKFGITSEWLACAMINREFLPEYLARLDEFPSSSEFRIAIGNTNFYHLATDMVNTVEIYFNIQLDSTELFETNARKIVLSFRNDYIPEGQKIIFYVEQTITTTPLGITLPLGEMKYQHDYLAYDGNVYSILETYSQHMEDSQGDDGHGSCYLDTTVDSSMALFEIVKNVRNGINVFMAYVEMEQCLEIIQTARKEQKEKNTKCVLMFDKIISPRTKLDFLIKIWDSMGGDITSGGMIGCAGCDVIIESGELVCSTKCCRRTMHPSCMLEQYLHEDCKHAEFRCDKCNVVRQDKYGRNTEMLMGWWV
mgnify:CR=1 FL=1